MVARYRRNRQMEKSSTASSNTRQTHMKKNVAYAFIDAANLMYGGKKSLGWSVDHKKLLEYIQVKYGATKAIYYAGVDLCGFPYDPVKDFEIDVTKLLNYLLDNKNKIIERDKHIQQVKFYRKLLSFGYELQLKPVKVFHSGIKIIKKANCDVDMTFDLMRLQDKYQTGLILSGDGDFFIVLKYLRHIQKKNIIIMSRAERTASEIRRLAGGKFVDFHYLRELLKFTDIKKERHPSRMPSTSVKRNITRKTRRVK